MKHVINHKAEAAGFKNKGDAYIHCEMKDGGKVEIIMKGDSKALIWVLVQIFRELSKQTKASVTELLGLINAMHTQK